MTPPRNISATVRLRRLGTALRDYRQAAGLTQVHAAKQLGWSEGKIVRLEGARATRPALKDIEAALDLYGVTEDARDDTIEIARQARTRGWWLSYRDVLLDHTAYVGFEQGASAIALFHPSVVPGLLQTAQYAAAIFASPPDPPDDEIDRRVMARTTRRLALERATPPTLSAVLSEAVVRQMVGGPVVMREQITHLIQISSRSNVSIQLLPFTVGAHAGLEGPFVVLDFPDPDDRPIVFMEAWSGGLFLDDDETLEYHRRVMAYLREVALPAAETLDVLDQLKEDLT